METKHSCKKRHLQTTFITVCSHCKRNLDKNGKWQQVEAIDVADTDVEFTHGLCPECAEKYYPREFKSVFE